MALAGQREFEAVHEGGLAVGAEVGRVQDMGEGTERGRARVAHGLPFHHQGSREQVTASAEDTVTTIAPVRLTDAQLEQVTAGVGSVGSVGGGNCAGAPGLGVE
jgi:hypothetical protein